METNTHYALKFKALQWLYQACSCRYIALELQFGKYIFDVIGSDGKNVYIIEAKQSKSDFLKDCNDPDVIKANIVSYKNLLIETGDKEYKKFIEHERSKSTKFYDKGFLKFSNERYIIAPDSVISEDIIPDNWGLLNEEPRKIKKSEITQIDVKYTNKIIKEIAKKNTKMYMKHIGVDFDTKYPVFPSWEHYIKEDR